MPINALLSYCAKRLSFSGKAINFKIRKTITVALILPAFVGVSAPTPAQAATVQALDGSCVQQVGSADGVSVTKVGNDCVVTFTSTTQTTWQVPANTYNFRYLIVGGGASGDRGVCGVYYGHGGGGGQVLDSILNVTPSTTLNIKVGNGGAASGACYFPGNAVIKGNPGGNSFIGNIVAQGGYESPNTTGLGGTSGTGFAGGTGASYTYPGGSGGGAAGAGTNLDGGAGLTSDITGTTNTYGSGGAGLTWTGSALLYGSVTDGGSRGTTPTANRGGGGSDGASLGGLPGAAGVVVIRYTQYQRTITLNKNGNTNTSALVPAQIGVFDSPTANKLPSASGLGKTGFNFGGWNTASDGSGTSFPGSNTSLAGLGSTVPFLRLEASNFDPATKVWTATNGDSIPAANVTGNPKSRIVKAGTAGSTETFTVVRGETFDGLKLTTSFVDNYTFCAVARIPVATGAGSAGSGGRLFSSYGTVSAGSATTSNWLSGWWAGYQGSFHHNVWLRDSRVLNDTNFHLVCDRYDSVRFDGVQVATFVSGGTRILPMLSVNMSNSSPSENSTWEVAEILIYNQELATNQVEHIEGYLKQRYGITAATSSVPSATSASNYQTSNDATLYAQWNSTITYINYQTATGTVPPAQMIPQAGAPVSGNTGNLAATGKTFIGWNTDGEIFNETRYRFGETYTPTTGSRSLYAQWVDSLALKNTANGTSTSAAIGAGVGGKVETLTATGGYLTKTLSMTPAIPGITLDTSTANTGVINVSSLVTAGTYVETVTVTDADGYTSNHLVTITVTAPIKWATDNSTTVTTTFGTARSTRLNITGGTTGKVVTMTKSTNIPSVGITIDTSTVSGSSYATLNISSKVLPGTYTITMSTTDSSKIKSNQVITVVVNKLPLLTFTKGTADTSTLVSGAWLQYEFGTSNTGTDIYVRDLTGNNSNRGELTAGTPYSSTLGGGSVTLSGTKKLWAFPGTISASTSLSKFYWIYPTAATGTIVTVCDSVCGYHESEFEMVDGKLHARVWALASLSTTETITLNAWHYVGYIYDAAGSSYIYINGRLAASKTNVGTRGVPTGDQWDAISAGDATEIVTEQNGQFSLGSVHYYKRVLSESEVWSNYANTAPRFLGSNFPGFSPSGSATITTTQGVASSHSLFTATEGTGGKVITLSSSNSGISLDTSTANSAILNIANTVTATNSTTQKVISTSVVAADSVTATTTYPLTLRINPPITITASTPTTVTSTYGVTAYDTFTAAYGTGTLTFTNTSSAFPSAFSLSGASSSVKVLTISNTLPAGTYIDTVTVTDSVGAVTNYVLTVIVNPALSIAGATTNSITTTRGKAGTLRINILNGTGTRTLTNTISTAGISIDSSTIASGNYVTLNSSTSVLTGTYTFTATVRDSLGATARETFTVTINAPPIITASATTLTTTQGVARSITGSTASFGTGNKIFSLTGLNPSISLETSTANAFTLTVSTAATSLSTSQARIIYETVTATDSVSAVVTQAFTITVNPIVAMSVTTNSITTTSGIAASDTFTATYGSGNKTFTLTGSPTTSGFSLTQSNNVAVLKVESTVNPGTYYETVTATDTVGGTKALGIMVTVVPGPTIFGSQSLITASGIEFLSPAFQVVNGVAPYTYTLASRAINPSTNATSGISFLSASLQIKITSSVPAGTYIETITVTDSKGAKSNLTVNLDVRGPVVLAGSLAITKVYGESYVGSYTTSGGINPYVFKTSTVSPSSLNVCAPIAGTYIGDGTNGTIGVSYTYEKLFSPQSCNWIAPAGVTTVDALVVGGGGSGGSRHAGGGGAGGLIYQSNISVSSSTPVAAVVGAGGAALPAPANGLQGNSGSGSQFGSISTVGGGGGGQNTNNGLGLTGGSGGGSTYTASGGSGTSAQGNNGGKGTWGDWEGNWSGGGGGGASSSGSAATSTLEIVSTPGSTINKTSGHASAGAGGSGISYGLDGNYTCYAAGGGGSISNSSNGSAGAGGSCGGVKTGGDGSKGYVTASSGTEGTGSGGGAGGFSGGSNAISGKGGSGVVIIRYLTPTADSTTVKVNTVTNAMAGGTASLTLSVPENTPRTVTSKLIRVVQSDGTTTDYTVNITINRATPTVSLSLPGSVTTAQYGTPVIISAATSTAGQVLFKNASTNITACTAVSTTAGIATCTWTPTALGATTLKATLTPTDTTNYENSLETSFSVNVLQADTLTVTAVNETFNYTGSSALVASRFSYRGLVSIDTLTSVMLVYSGTANDGTAYQSGVAPSLAGTYVITPETSKGGIASIASNYKAIAVETGTLTINRVLGAVYFAYNNNTNSVTYTPTGTYTPNRIDRAGTGLRTFSTTSPSVCSIDSVTAVVTPITAGNCYLVEDLAQDPNYTAYTKYRTLVINKAPRTIALSSISSSLKYADSATVTTTLSGGTLDGAITYSLNANPGCDFDTLGGILTSTSATLACTLNATVAEGTNYLTASTTSPLAITMAKADAPVITLDTVTAVDYVPGQRAQISPTYTITGFKGSDAGTVTLTYTLIAAAAGFSFTYSETATPTDAGIYGITPSALTMSVGDVSNYETPNYASSLIRFTINRIAQAPLTIENLNGEVDVPFEMIARGGSTNGALTFTKISGANCSVSGNELNATSAGSCILTVTMSGDRNYLDVTSDSVTVVVRNYVLTPIFVFGGAAGISISTTTTLTIGEIACTVGCVPNLASFTPDEGAEGDVITLTGTMFTGATRVIFNAEFDAAVFSVISDTQIAVQVPAGLEPGEGTIEIETSRGVTPRVFGFTVLP